MKGIFWNSRGLRDLAKFRFLSDITKEQNLDFIALIETCRKNFTDTELNNICGDKQFLWSWIDPGGIPVESCWVLIHPSLTLVLFHKVTTTLNFD